MKLSIIVPIFNGEKYLDNCITSIINLSFTDFELILINDGSDDNTLDICKKYELKDKRVKIISLDKNQGVSNARNLGINLSKGQYIGFVDADDYLDINRYKKAIEKADKFNADIVLVGIINEKYGEQIPISNSHNKEGLIVKGKTPNYPGSVPVKIIKKTFIDKHKIRFYNKSYYAEDTAFMALIYMYNPVIYCIDEILYFRVLHNDSSTNKLKHELLNTKLNTLYTLTKCKYDLINRSAEDKWIKRIEKYIANIIISIDNLH